MPSQAIDESSAPAPRLGLARDHDALQLRLSGTWKVGESTPDETPVCEALASERPARITFATHELSAWDSALVAFAAAVAELASGANVPVDPRGLPEGARRLLALAVATPKSGAAPRAPKQSRIARIGTRTLERRDGVMTWTAWIGELAIASAKLVARRAHFRRSDLFVQMQATGARAFGIVSLIASLVGLILGFVGAVQLKQFGASIYVADLVGIAMVREMGAMMTAIVVAGRTGAAFAAELGTMRVTQEIDALTTLAISPIEFLALPRVIAVTLMMPLLCVYADLMGVIGGAVVGIGAMGITPRIYLDRTLEAISVSDLLGGMFKATVYGFLIGSAACLEGLRAGRSAAAVGKAATRAVVDGIVLVIAACGVFAVLFYILGL